MKGWIGVFWPGPPAPPTRWSVDAEYFPTLERAEIVLEYRVKGKRLSRPPTKVGWRDGLPVVLPITRPWLFEAVGSLNARILLHRAKGLTFDKVQAEPFGEVTVEIIDGQATHRPSNEQS